MANTPFLDLVKPAGTDRALVSVINSNSDKIDTGVSTLSEQIGTLNIGSVTIANFQSALQTAGAALSNGGSKNFYVSTTDASDPIIATAYVGTIKRTFENRYEVTMQRNNGNDVLVGSYGSAGWKWNQFAFNDRVETYDLGSQTLANMETALSDLVTNFPLKMGQTLNIKYTCSATAAPFTNGHVYGGTFRRTGSAYWTILYEDPEGLPIYGTYKNGTWAWQQIATAEKLFVSHSSSERNWNNLTKAGFHFTYITTSSGTNAPFTGYEGWVFTMIFNDGSYVSQVAIKWSGKTIVSRYLNISSGSWSSWA